MNFAEKLLHLRKREGLSQEDLAAHLEVSRQAVSRWEMGTALPDAPNLLRISKRFGVTVDFLLNDSEPEHPVVAEDQISRYTKQKQQAAVLLLVGMQSLACLCGLIGRFIQSELMVWIGLTLNLVGVIAFEAGFLAYFGTRAVQDSRGLFYRISVWFFAYSPVHMAVTALWRLYPRPHLAFLEWGSALTVYLLICVFTSVRLTAPSPKKDEKESPPVNHAEG